MMTARMPSTNRECFTVRVLRAGSAAPAGVGFIVGDRRIVTCAHVVNVALGRGKREAAMPGPDMLVQVDFPLLGNAPGAVPRGCRVVCWKQPPAAGISGGDVAGLEIVDGVLPAGTGVARLIDPAAARDARVAVFGYPQDRFLRRPDGAWAMLRLLGGIGGGSIQLDAAGDSAFRAQPGYSGSPVVASDMAGDVVIGMFSAASDQEEDKDSYAIPVSFLAEAWPGAVSAGMTPAIHVTAQTTAPAFTRAIRERYMNRLAGAGLDVPDDWTCPELGRLRRDWRDRETGSSLVGDLLESLCTALEAMPFFKEIGGHEVSTRKLQDLYRQHIGRWPDAGSSEGMLILAASAGIAERRRAAAEPGSERDSLTALARFMLGIAGHRKAPARANPNDPSVRALIDWLADSLGQQPGDALAYLDRCGGGRTWALIELRADDTDPSVRAWPDQIIVDLVADSGECTTTNVRVGAASDEGVLLALRRAIGMLPDGEVCIDLLLPRRWLEVGVEHWDVVDVGGMFESMGRHLEPRLRWAMHRHNRWLRKRLETQFGRVDWSADPEVLPASILGDPARFAGWIQAHDQDGAEHPPFFAGFSRGAGGAGGHDPFGVMLREGHGMLVWFNHEPHADACQAAARLCAGMSRQERRYDLPRVLARKLEEHRPVIVWTDPEGRAGFDLPPSRRGGTLRGGGR